MIIEINALRISLILPNPKYNYVTSQNTFFKRLHVTYLEIFSGSELICTKPMCTELIALVI